MVEAKYVKLPKSARTEKHQKIWGLTVTYTDSWKWVTLTGNEEDSKPKYTHDECQRAKAWFTNAFPEVAYDVVQGNYVCQVQTFYAIKTDLDDVPGWFAEFATDFKIVTIAYERNGRALFKDKKDAKNILGYLSKTDFKSKLVKITRTRWFRT